MKLVVLDSGSCGNCYLLIGNEETLILEAGVPFKRLLEHPAFDLSRVKGCLVSHEHADHAGRIREYLRRGIDCHASPGTIGALACNALKPLHGTVHLGGFKILPFPTKHDAAEPYGFLIKHAECGTVLFATDTYFLPYRFEGINHFLIECNYRQELLDRNFADGKIDRTRRDRTILSHMEVETCIQTLKENDLSHVNNIVLLHLSDMNSNEKAFVGQVTQATRRITTAATPGLTINLDKEL